MNKNKKFKTGKELIKLDEELKSFKHPKIDQKFVDQNLDYIYKIYNDFVGLLSDNNIKTNLGSVQRDLQEVNYAMQQIYIFLYDQKKSHLKRNDIDVFVSFLMMKFKSIKDVIEQFKE